MSHGNRRNLIKLGQTAFEAMDALNKVPDDTTLFILNEQEQVVGSLTDGDLRRGFLKGMQLTDPVEKFMNHNFKFLDVNNLSPFEIERLRALRLRLLPVLTSERKLVKFVNLNEKRSLLPLDAVLMAGGEGKRLLPLTEKTPKPLLRVGDKPIIEHNIDRLCNYGIETVVLSIRHFGEQLVSYFGNGESKGIKISYIREDEPLGTIGALRKITDFKNKYVLVMNSDLLTNIDFEDFFKYFLEKKADMAIASIPYKVDIPYAIFETSEERVLSLKEKPELTYYSNAGIYLLKTELVPEFVKEGFFNATDLIEGLIEKGKKVIYYPMFAYWLDIGKHDDFKKAQEDIKHIKL